MVMESAGFSSLPRRDGRWHIISKTTEKPTIPDYILGIVCWGMANQPPPSTGLWIHKMQPMGFTDFTAAVEKQS